ncbi:MAG: histidinol phosphate phosphatase domain-containing protein [Deltaproteobacteria bacterium]
MIDLHTHSIFSDGELVPAELAQRAYSAGYKAIAITDHADFSNFDFIIPRMIDVCTRITARGRIMAFPGIEITHVDPADIAELALAARKLGAQIVVVHGETIVEPVAPKTNFAALNASVDILAHPGLITEEDVRLAAEKGIYLEITTRRGHAYCNGHVAAMARKYQASLILNNDAHAPGDFIGEKAAVNVARGAGLSDGEISALFNNSEKLVQRICV